MYKKEFATCQEKDRGSSLNSVHNFIVYNVVLDKDLPAMVTPQHGYATAMNSAKELLSGTTR
jgi:hypothetical protein